MTKTDTKRFEGHTPDPMEHRVYHSDRRVNNAVRCIYRMRGMRDADPSGDMGSAIATFVAQAVGLAPALLRERDELAAALRNTLASLEAHISAEAYREGVGRDELCPCHANEVRAARAALARLEEEA